MWFHAQSDALAEDEQEARQVHMIKEEPPITLFLWIDSFCTALAGSVLR